MQHACDSSTAGGMARYLAERLDPLLPVYALIDPLLGEPPLPGLAAAVSQVDDAEQLDEVRSETWRCEVVRVALDRTIPLPIVAHPYLVQISVDLISWLTETLRLGCAERRLALVQGMAPYRIGGWLQSAEPMPVLGERLANLCTLHTTARTSARYLRIADRRVLAYLRHVVGDRRLAAQLPGISRWLWLDDAGTVQGMSLHDEAAEESRPLVLTPAEWQQLERGRDVHPVRARALGHGAGAAVRFAAVERALDSAPGAVRRWPERFASAADRHAWALLLLQHPGFDTLAITAQVMRDGDPAFPELPGDPPEGFASLAGVLEPLLAGPVRDRGNVADGPAGSARSIAT